MPCNFLCLKLCVKKWCISAMTFFHQDTKVFSVLKWILSRVFIVGGWSLTWRTMFSHVMSVIKKWGPLPNCSALKSYQAGSPMEKFILISYDHYLTQRTEMNTYSWWWKALQSGWSVSHYHHRQRKWLQELPSMNFYQGLGTRMKCLQIREGTLRASYSEKCARSCGSIKRGLHRTDNQGMAKLSVTTAPLWCYIDGCPKSWYQYLGQSAGALRSAINRHTGYTANKLMLGREVKVPATILYRPMIFKMGRKEK